VAILIGFTGFDGTGKTTQAKKLQHALLMQGIRANYVHVFSPKSTISGELSKYHTVDSLTDAVDSLSNTKSGAILELAIRLPTLFLESWLTVYREKQRSGVSIYDRYFYDKLIAILSSYSKKLSLPIKKKILWAAILLPKPDIAIMFRIRPEIANRRKREHTLEEATEICALYNELSRILSINTINAEKEIDEVQEVIQRLCNKNFNIELKRQHQK